MGQKSNLKNISHRDNIKIELGDKIRISDELPFVKIPDY